MNITLDEHGETAVREWLISAGQLEYVDLVPQLWLDQEAPSREVQLVIGLVVLALCAVHNVSAVLLVIVFVQ